jgi:hypothetical protein
MENLWRRTDRVGPLSGMVGRPPSGNPKFATVQEPPWEAHIAVESSRRTITMPDGEENY